MNKRVHSFFYLSLITIIFLFIGCKSETNKNSTFKTESNKKQNKIIQDEPPKTNKPNFRGIPFGTKREKVLDWEDGDPFIKNDGRVAYRGETAGLSAIRVYYFTADSNKFVTADYIFREQHSNRNLYINDYKNVQSILEDIYGEPTSGRGEIWLDDLYRDEPSQYGFAVSLGDLRYRYEWKTDSLKVIHILRGDNYKITHTASYGYIPLLKVFKKEIQEKAKSDF
jgi:hypothetical protein